jgi:serine/threonine-protein kinase
MLPGRVETTLPRPQGDVFYCSPEALLGHETDPRSDLFSLGLVLLEVATWGHLYSTANARLADLEEALTPAAKQQILDATINALSGYEEMPGHAEDCILRAATFAREDVEEITQRLAPPLRPIVRRLIQRKPEDRYPSAADVEADLRAGLASLAGSYGPKEVLEEVHSALEGARRNRRVIGPTSEEQLPPVFATEDDTITAPGGAD